MTLDALVCSPGRLDDLVGFIHRAESRIQKHFPEESR